MDIHNAFVRIKNIVLPALLLSSVTGVLTGVLVYFFKRAAEFVMHEAGAVYAFVAANPAYTPLLLLGLLVLAMAAWGLITWCPNARGGGIPSAVGVLRGILRFEWFKTLVATIGAALISFAAGLPLGNEGPSVQVGTALGRGVTRLSGHSHRAWDRYLMTGGASAGFAVAACAPITGLFFALEEAHRRFSPMILMSGLTSVFSATATMQALTAWLGGSATFIHMPDPLTLSLPDLWLPLVLGLVAGGCAALYSLGFRWMDRLLKNSVGCWPAPVKIGAVFLLCGVAGLLNLHVVGSGHLTIEHIFEQKLLWNVLLSALLLRAALMLLASKTGITGGLFIPMLTIGALIGGLCANGFFALGMDNGYYLAVVVLCITAFMGAASHTPITALIFAVEALSGLSNVLYIGVAVFVAYAVMELLAVDAVNDEVLHHRIAELHHGKARYTKQATVTVQPDAFAVGKTLADLFFPNSCLILSVKKGDRTSMASGGAKGLFVGDVLHIHFDVYEGEQEEMDAAFCALFGEQKIESVPVDNN